MDKNARQVGFNAIRELNWERKSLNSKKDVLSRYFKIFIKYQGTKAVDIWKQHAFHVVSRKTVQTRNTNQVKSQNDQYRIQS